MSGNKWRSAKVGANLLCDLVIFSILSSYIPLDLHDSMRVKLLKYLMFFLIGINTKTISNIPKEKYFAPFWMLNLFIRSFVNPFADIALTFLIVHLIHFHMNFDTTSFSLLSKSVLFTKPAISLLLNKFACLNLAVKLSDVNLLNSGVVIYLL